MSDERQGTSAEPAWFAHSVVMLFDLYPGAYIGTTTVRSWWGYLRDLPIDALRPAFRLAIKASPDRCPSAAQVRAHAESTAKTLDTPAADLTRPALPEHDEPPTDPFWRSKWEAYKRGEIPRGPNETKAELDQLASLRGRP